MTDLRDDEDAMSALFLGSISAVIAGTIAALIAMWLTADKVFSFLFGGSIFALVINRIHRWYATNAEREKRDNDTPN